MDSKIVKKIKQDHNLSQGEIAKELCVSQATVSYWEHGKRKISKPIQKLIKMLFFHPSRELPESEMPKFKSKR